MANDRWLFSQHEVLNTPSRRCGIDSDHELEYRQRTSQLIQDVGQRLQVTQLCINTGIVYMHRFYMFQSFKKFKRELMGASCLFLAAKVEEQPRKLEHVIRVFQMLINKESSSTPPIDTKSKAYLDQAQELVDHENILLQTIGFDITIDHPHPHVMKTCELIKAPKDLSQTSYFLASNSLHLTTMCLNQRPTVVACVCVYLACKWARWEIPVSKEGREWYSYIDPNITLDVIEALSQDFLASLNKYPSKMKKLRTMSREDNKDIKIRSSTTSIKPSVSDSSTCIPSRTSQPHGSSQSHGRTSGSNSAHPPYTSSSQSHNGQQRDSSRLPHPSSRPSQGVLPASHTSVAPRSNQPPPQPNQPPPQPNQPPSTHHRAGHQMVLEESNMRRVKTEPTLSISPKEYMARKQREKEEQQKQLLKQQQKQDMERRTQEAKRRSLDPVTAAGRHVAHVPGDRRSLDPSRLPHTSHDKQQPVKPSSSSRGGVPYNTHHRPTSSSYSHSVNINISSSADKTRKSLSHAGGQSGMKHPLPLQATEHKKLSKTEAVSFTLGGTDLSAPMSVSGSSAALNKSLPTFDIHSAKQKDIHNISMPNLHHKQAKTSLPTLTIPLTSTDSNKDLVDITLSTPTTICTPSYDDHPLHKVALHQTTRAAPHEPPQTIKTEVQPVNIPVDVKENDNGGYTCRVKSDLKSPTKVTSDQLSKLVDVTSPTVDLVKLDVVSPVKLDVTSQQWPLTGVAPGIHKLKRKLGPNMTVQNTKLSSHEKYPVHEALTHGLSPGGSDLTMKLKLSHGASPTIVSSNTLRSEKDIVSSPLKIKIPHVNNHSPSRESNCHPVGECVEPKVGLKLVINKERFNTSENEGESHHRRHKHKHKHHKKRRSHHHHDREDREHRHSRKRAHSPGHSRSHGDHSSSAKHSRPDLSAERYDQARQTIGELMKATQKQMEQQGQSAFNARTQQVLSSNVQAPAFCSDSPEHGI